MLVMQTTFKRSPEDMRVFKCCKNVIFWLRRYPPNIIQGTHTFFPYTLRTFFLYANNVQMLNKKILGYVNNLKIFLRNAQFLSSVF